MCYVKFQLNWIAHIFICYTWQLWETCCNRVTMGEHTVFISMLEAETQS